MKFGNFSEDALEKASVSYNQEYAEYLEETYDFTRCVRADGSAYGTSGTCRKGTPGDKKEEEKPSSSKSKALKYSVGKDTISSLKKYVKALATGGDAKEALADLEDRLEELMDDDEDYEGSGNKDVFHLKNGGKTYIVDYGKGKNGLPKVSSEKSDEDEAADQLGSMLPKGEKIQKSSGKTVLAKGGVDFTYENGKVTILPKKKESPSMKAMRESKAEALAAQERAKKAGSPEEKEKAEAERDAALGKYSAARKNQSAASKRAKELAVNKKAGVPTNPVNYESALRKKIASDEQMPALVKESLRASAARDEASREATRANAAIRKNKDSSKTRELNAAANAAHAALAKAEVAYGKSMDAQARRTKQIRSALEKEIKAKVRDAKKS